MAWKQKVTDGLADLLRFAIRSGLMVCGIAFSVAMAYLSLKFCWFFVRFLDRTIFAQPW